MGPLLVWLGCLAAAIALLAWLGDGRLAAPSLTDPASWSDWARSRPAVEVAGVALRLLALALAWYLTGVTGIAVLARLLRVARLVRLADALSVGPVRTLAQQAVGLGLATGVLVTAIPATPAATEVATPVELGAGVALLVDAGTGVDQPGAPPATAEPVAADPVLGDVTVPVPGLAPPVPATTTPLPADTPDPAGVADAAPAEVAPADVAPADVAPADVAPADAAPGAQPPAPAGAAAAHGDTGTLRTVRVAPGDHLWSLAERDVEDALGRPATEAEVASHWLRVVAANVDTLRVPGNPDFLVPGQQVLLPAVELEGAS